MDNFINAGKMIAIANIEGRRKPPMDIFIPCFFTKSASYYKVLKIFSITNN